jgi:nicotinamidase-related amidase
LFKEAEQWTKAHGIPATGGDKSNIHLLLIDVQKDFCFPQGTLYVAGGNGIGAITDSKKICQFIYRNLGSITNITTTLDTHFAFQIFFPWFWVDSTGSSPNPHTIITVDKINKGEFVPNPKMASWLCNGNYPWLQKQVSYYCEELEKAGKYQLYLWPPHCILGSEGHALVGVVHEARLFHEFCRGSQSWCEVKGGHPLTENYSVLRPEVLMRHDGQPLTQKNTSFIKTLLSSDAVIIAGQAASHCVKSSIDDLLDEILAQDPKLVEKVYILEDCMSSVVIPGVVDFTPETEKSLKKFKDAGMHVVKSTDGMHNWLKV